MQVVQVNYAYDSALTDPGELLDRYSTLTGWSDAVLGAGARRVSVVQRFSRDAQLRRNGVDYLFRATAGGPVARLWSWPRTLHRAVALLQPDVVHVNGLKFPLQTRLLRRTLPAAALVVQDHKDGFHTDRVRQAVHRAGLRVADGFMFAASALVEPWRAAGLIEPYQPVYEVMESSTTLRPLPRATARNVSGVRGDPALLWVGRLNENKDPITVIEGFGRALPALPNARLTMVYHSDELLPLVKACLKAAPELASRVHLVGHVPWDAIAAFYSAADLFVLGSHREGSGYALIEALACGAIPVVTDIPTFRVITAGGSLGALWPPGDGRGLATALTHLWQRDVESLRAAVGVHFVHRLSWAAVGPQAMTAYRDVTARREDAQRRLSA